MAILVVVLVVAAAGTVAWVLVRRRNAARSGPAGVLAVAAPSGPWPAAVPPEAAPARVPPAAQVHAWLAALMFQREAVPTAAPTPVGLQVNAAARRVLERVESQPRYMPRRPQVLPQLMRAANDPEASGRTIAGIIQRDPALAGNLLRIANSALYRVQAKPVESLERAVALVGSDGLRQIVASALVQPVGGIGGGPWGTAMAVAWDHTQLAAIATAEFARRRGEDAFAAHLLALLHGLGSTVVLQVLRDQYVRQPGVAVDVAASIDLMREATVATAARICGAWQLTERSGAALAEQGPTPLTAGLTAAGMPASTLGRALYLGRLAGSLAMLVRAGRLEPEEAQATLADSGEPDVAQIIARLTRDAA